MVLHKVFLLNDGIYVMCKVGIDTILECSCSKFNFHLVAESWNSYFVQSHSSIAPA